MRECTGIGPLQAIIQNVQEKWLKVQVQGRGFLLFSPNKVFKTKSRFFCSDQPTCVERSSENKKLIVWFPQNNTFIHQCNLFAYHKYMPTHSCKLSITRNYFRKFPENMQVPIASHDMVAAILFNFCGRWLDHPRWELVMNEPEVRLDKF